MPSERSELEGNKNGSKNTRMDITKSFGNFDIRKEEIMHIGRYYRAIAEIETLAKKLDRPIKILELGCGECYTMQLFYKAIIKQKDLYVKRFIGVDIDEPMLERVRVERAPMLKTCNGKLIAQDLTVNPLMKVKDNFFDLVICFEMLEHIKPEFVSPILEEINRIVCEDGTVLISTPNIDGAGNHKFPKDHICEWSYDDLVEEIGRSLELVSSHGIGVNISKIPKDELKKLNKIKSAIFNAYGNNSFFSSTVLGAFCDPAYCKNVLYVCKKEIPPFR